MTIHRAGQYILVTALVIISSRSALAQQPFTEESSARGINYVTAWSVGAGNGHGVAFADFDNDGDDDLITQGAEDGVVGIWENIDGMFIDRSATAGLPLLPEASGVVAADYDGDGWIDLYFTQSLMANVLMRNTGGFAFEDRTDAAGLADGALGSQGACFGDYDGDGLLDLYVCEIGSVNPLYRNQGDGTFVDVSAEVGVAEGSEWPSFQAMFWDYDLDGDLDLYLGHDKAWGWPDYRGNRLWRNDGDGTFTDVTIESGAAASIGCMGLTVGDINHDQWPDIYMSNTTLDTDPYGNPLFVNNGDATFVQSNVEAGVVSERWGWGVLFWDFDNNGFEDIYICNTNIATGANALLANDGAFPLVNVAPEYDMEDWGDSYTCALSDIDNDGDLDIVVVSTAQPVQLYINHEGESRNWLKFKLIGKGTNPFAVGTRIDLTAAGLTIQRHVFAGEGFKSSSSYMVHVGLDQAHQADELSVTWPGGLQSTIVTAIPANQTVILDEQNCSAAPAWLWSNGADTPFPPDGALSASTDAELSWSGVAESSYSVYFGTVSPPPLVADTTATAYSPGSLDEGTTYYWRVDTRACVVSSGATWSFTTATAADEPAPGDLPVVLITGPVSDAEMITDSSTIVLTGTASSGDELIAMVWASDQGPSGPCAGLANWSTGPIELLEGLNVITVSATDRLQNRGAAELRATYIPPLSIPDSDDDEPIDAEDDDTAETDQPEQDDPAPLDETLGDDAGQSPEGEDDSDGDSTPDSETDAEQPATQDVADDSASTADATAEESDRGAGSGICGAVGTLGWGFLVLGAIGMRRAFGPQRPRR